VIRHPGTEFWQQCSQSVLDRIRLFLRCNIQPDSCRTSDILPGDTPHVRVGSSIQIDTRHKSQLQVIPNMAAITQLKLSQL
jgi:hypothetical protein